MPLWGQLVDHVPGDLTHTVMNSPLPRCALYTTGAQTLTGNGTVYWAFGAGTELSDPLDFHNTVTNNGRITPTVAGVYRFHGNIRLSGSAGAGASAFFRLNGTTIFGREQADTAGSATFAGFSITGTYELNGTSDYVEFGTTSTTATARTTSLLGFACTFLGQTT